MKKLPPGTYTIPPDCKAVIKSGLITITPRQKLSRRQPRCSSCRHFAQGHATAGGRITSICLLHPKTSKQPAACGQLYYATLPKKRTCHSYAPRPLDITDSSDFN